MKVNKILVQIRHRIEVYGDVLYGLVCLAGYLSTGEKAKIVYNEMVVQVWKSRQNLT